MDRRYPGVFTTDRGQPYHTMDHRCLDRRSVVAALGATAAGCIGGPDGQDGDDGTGDSGTDETADDGQDGSTNGSLENGTDGDAGGEGGDSGGDGDGTQDGTDEDGRTADDGESLDCERVHGRYGRYEPGESPFVFTVELPDEAEVREVRGDGLWELKVERSIDDHTIEFELSQNGPKDALSPRFRGEGEDPVVDETEFAGTTVPIVRYETQSWPQYLTGVPVPGSDGSYATVVTQVDVIDPSDRVVDGVCTDAVDAMQRHVLGSIEPNPDHTLGSGADG